MTRRGRSDSAAREGPERAGQTGVGAVGAAGGLDPRTGSLAVVVVEAAELVDHGHDGVDATNDTAGTDISAEDAFWDVAAERINGSGADVIVVNGDTTSAIRGISRNGLDQEVWAVDAGQLVSLGSSVTKEQADGVITISGTPGYQQVSLIRVAPADWTRRRPRSGRDLRSSHPGGRPNRAHTASGELHRQVFTVGPRTSILRQYQPGGPSLPPPAADQDTLRGMGAGVAAAAMVDTDRVAELSWTSGHVTRGFSHSPLRRASVWSSYPHPIQRNRVNMPRTPYATPGTEAPGATPVYEGLKAQMGMVPNVVQLLGHSGPAAAGLAGVLDTLFNQLEVDPKLRELAYLVVAKTNESSYCIGHHTMFASEAGWSDDEIARIGPGAGTDTIFEPKGRAVAQFAEEVTRNVTASDEALDAIAEQLSPPEVADITFTVAAANLVQRVGKNLGAELEF